MEIAILLVQIAVSVLWIQQGFARYGFWEDKTPSGGFVPIIFALLVLGVSLVILFRKLIRKESNGGDGAVKVFHFDNFIPATGAIVGALMIQLVGIAPAVFFFSAIWMRYLSKYSWVKSLLSSAVFTVFIYGVFRFWLRVPFPRGIIIELF